MAEPATIARREKIKSNLCHPLPVRVVGFIIQLGMHGFSEKIKSRLPYPPHAHHIGCKCETEYLIVQ